MMDNESVEGAQGYVSKENNVDVSWQKRTLIFPISALYFFVHTFLHFSLEDSSSSWFIVIGDLQDMRRVDPIVGPTTHDVVSSDIVFVHGDLCEFPQTVVSVVKVERHIA